MLYNRTTYSTSLTHQSDRSLNAMSYPIQQRRNSRSDLSVHTAPQPHIHDSLSPPTNELSRTKTTETTSGTRKHRSGSIISRLKGDRSPVLAPTTLPDNSPKGDRRSRRLSQSSGKVRSIAASIGKKLPKDIGSKRHSRAHDAYSDGNESDTEDEEDSDIADDLEVTGFAVASTRRNADFHALFTSVDEGDYLIEGESGRLGMN